MITMLRMQSPVRSICQGMVRPVGLLTQAGWQALQFQASWLLMSLSLKL